MFYSEITIIKIFHVFEDFLSGSSSDMSDRFNPSSCNFSLISFLCIKFAFNASSEFFSFFQFIYYREDRI